MGYRRGARRRAFRSTIEIVVELDAMHLFDAAMGRRLTV